MPIPSGPGGTQDKRPPENSSHLMENRSGSGFASDEVLTDPRDLAKNDTYFQEFFASDAEEEIAMEKIRSSSERFYSSDEYEKTSQLIAARLKDLKTKFPSGGFRSYWIVTADIMRQAPADFFARFEEDNKIATAWVQSQLAEGGLAQQVADATANPKDNAKQDIAFRTVQGFALEYMDKLRYRGIDRSIVQYMVIMDVMGFSRIEPLWRDRSVDEIIINGPYDIQIESRGHLYKVPSCQFRDPEHLEVLLERIFGVIGKTLSRATPYLDGRLYDQSRIAATHRIIAPAGPNVAIRRHPEKYWTPMDLIEYGSASEDLFAEVGNLIRKGCSYIVIGGTSSGKTSLLNATSCFYDPTQRVLTLEDNLELRLHPGKLVGAPMECVPANPNKIGDKGVTMRELVRACLRMRPDGIVVGEVRDGAMYDLCQALNTGHWGASSVHANSPYDGIYRMQSLVTQAELISDESALPLIAAAFDFIIMVEHFPEDGSRKITSICEIDPYPSISKVDGRRELGVRPLWEFEDAGIVDEKVVGEWKKVGTLSEVRRKRRHLDLTPDLSWDELAAFCEIPEKFKPGSGASH